MIIKWINIRSAQVKNCDGALLLLFFFLTDESFMCLTKHEPVGVCGAIIPVSPEGDLVWIYEQ